MLLTYSARIHSDQVGSFIVLAATNELSHTHSAVLHFGSTLSHIQTLQQQRQKGRNSTRDHTAQSNHGIYAAHATLHLGAFQSGTLGPNFMPGWGHLGAENEALKTKLGDQTIN